MAAIEKLTRTFNARTQDGREETIMVFTEFFDASTLDGPSGMQPTGRFRLETSQGRHVNHLGKGKYIMLGTRGEKIPLTSRDPNAP